MVPSFIQFRSIANEHPVTRSERRRLRIIVLAMLATLAAWVGYSAVASATEPPKGKCSFMYINGDLVISCPKAGR